MITLILFLFGLIFGSFINALVWRLHSKKDWVKERSICPHCKHVLAAKDLVPVVSWLMLKGKCRYCKKPISAQYPAVELLTASLFALSFTFWPSSFNLPGILAFGVWLFVLVLLIALLVYDVRWMLLPNKLVAVLTVASVVLVVLLAWDGNGVTYVLQALLGAGVFFAIFWLLFTLSSGKWIGGGDVKLAFSLGLIAGSLNNVLLTIFIASLLGTVLITPMLLSKRLKVHSKIPFGPFLILATIIVFWFGTRMISWYLETFLYI